MSHGTTVLLTARDSGPDGYDRIFLVGGIDGDDCMERFRAYARSDDGAAFLGVDLRTIKYLGDGPGAGELALTDPYGVVELDTSNNAGYTVSVRKD